jgi:hypothetical protein
MSDFELIKIFSFCEQTLKIGANDASGQTKATICALKQASKYFFKKITGIRSQVPAIFSENNKVVLGDFN